MGSLLWSDWTYEVSFRDNYSWKSRVMACAPSGYGGLATISSEVTKLNITIYPYMYIVPEMKVELLLSRRKIGK